jgi:dihydroorotate dehydrogenase
MHTFVSGLMRFAYSIPPVRAIIRSMFNYKHPSLEREFCGLKFSNPVGLAAGFDKDAKLYKSFSTLGFSFIEIGTVTPKGQPGNPKPRLFRIVQDGALINRMGFNNKGVDAAVERLKSSRPDIIIGGNIGKNTNTPNEEAPADYLYCFRQLYPYVDYFTINVSCPNVVNLSALQSTESLTGILSVIMEERDKQEQRKPVLLKISPDLSFVHLDEVLDLVEKMNVDGIVAVNTTTQRSGLTMDKEQVERLGWGGLSGKPLTWKALETINYIRQRTKGKLPIIGVGGIMSEEDAINHIMAGATLLQIYSGFIYQGPALIKRINKAIVQMQQKKAQSNA